MENPFHGSGPDLKLIETLLWDGSDLIRLPRHLARLSQSAARLGWPCDPVAAETALRQAAPVGPARMRLTLDSTGTVEVTMGALASTPPLWRVALADARIASDDPWLSVKSTQRALYDQSRAALPPGIDELIFLNERDQICEGTITNVFYDLGDGLCTPPLTCGLLPGVLRGEMLALGQCRERVLHLSELPRAGIWMGNSLRGLFPAELT